MANLENILKGGIQKEEVPKIEKIYNSLKQEEKEQAKAKIKAQIESDKNNLSSDIKASLQILIGEVNETNQVKTEEKAVETKEVENQPSLSMEQVKAGNTSDVFKVFFEKKLFDMYLSDRLKSFPTGSQETIKVVLWNQLLNKASTQGLLDTLGSKITSILDIFNKSENEEQAQEGLKTEIGNNPDNSGKLIDEMKELSTMIDGVMIKEYVNLTKLGELSKSLSKNDFADLTNNPSLVDDYLKTGNLSEENGKSYKSNSVDNQKFLDETLSITNKIGSMADTAKNGLGKLMGFAEKLGFSKEDMKSMVDELSNIPVIGVFFKLLFRFITGDLGVDQTNTQIEQAKIEDTKKISLKNFLVFSKDVKNKNYFPEGFTLNNENEFSDFDGFFTKINEAYLKTPNLNEEQKKIGFNDTIKASDFWEKIYTGKGITAGSIEEEIYKKLKDINEHNPKYDKKEYLENINKIDLSNYKKEVVSEKSGDNTIQKTIDVDKTQKTESPTSQDTTTGAQPEKPSQVDTKINKPVETKTTPPIVEQKTPETKPKEVEKKPEKSKTIKEQLESGVINDFVLEGGKPVKLGFNPGNKEIQINGTSYHLSILKGSFDVTGGVKINTMSVNEISYSGLSSGKVAIKPEYAEKMIIDLYNNHSSILPGLGDDGDITVKIA